MQRVLLLISFSIFVQFSFAQSWVEKMQDPHVNFYEVQESFNNTWENQSYERGKGYKQYKRWEYFMEPRVYPSGNRPSTEVMVNSVKKFKSKNSPAKENTPWLPLGPVEWESIGWNPGLGRVNAVVEHPENAEIIYIGTPAGGVWKTEDGGSNWTPLTDDLPTLGVSAIAINPLDPDVMYIGTGDGDGGDTYSMGVLRSTNAGVSWNSTGLSFNISSQIRCTRLIIHPTDTAVVWASTLDGVYKSINSGESWTMTHAGNVRDFEINPTNPDILYISGSFIFKSTDGGDSFQPSGNGLPSAGNVSRIEMAVTPANPDYIYALLANSEDNGFLGLYKSEDGGESFEEKSNSPNILTYAFDGDGVGGQSWYDLALAASPTDPEEIYAGGINVWRSSNGGSDWDIISHWIYPSDLGYTHADIHTLYYPGNTLYCGSDGGIFLSENDGSSWDDRSFGLQISQYYRISVSTSDSEKLLTASQDNGTNLFSAGSTYLHLLGGDGNGAEIDYSNDDIMYSAYPQGSIQKSEDGGNSFWDITQEIDESGAWVTPFQLHPTNPNILFAGYENVWKRVNGTWTQLSTFSSSTLRSLKVAPSDADIIYTANLGNIYKTTDGGDNWMGINSNLPDLAITSIEVHPEDPLQIWITFSGYEAGEKVYFSENGGENWINISSSLPNMPVNCITREPGAENALYIGTDNGLFYTNDNLVGWQSFDEDLPNVIINQLVIHTEDQKIFAATYGRGVWVNNLFENTSALPVAAFSAVETRICEDGSVHFENNSINSNIDNIHWYFEGGTPAESTEVNPEISYNEAGIFEVKLVVGNDNGLDSIIKINFIEVLPQQGTSTPVMEDFEAASSLADAGFSIVDTDEDEKWELNESIGYESNKSVWINNFNNMPQAADQLISTTYDLSGLDTAIITFRAAYARRLPSNVESLIIDISNDCGETWLFRKNFISVSTLSTVDPSTSPFIPENETEWALFIVDNIHAEYRTENFRFRFNFSSSGGNNIYIDDININNESPTGLNDLNSRYFSLDVFPNPAKNRVSINFELDKNSPVQIDLIDVAGRELHSLSTKNYPAGPGQVSMNIKDISAGVYFVRIRSGKSVETQKLIIQ